MKQPISTIETPPLLLRDLIQVAGKKNAAVAAALGVAPSHVTRLCNGEFVLDIRHAPPLAEFLDQTLTTVVKAAIRTAAPRQPQKKD